MQKLLMLARVGDVERRELPDGEAILVDNGFVLETHGLQSSVECLRCERLKSKAC